MSAKLPPIVVPILNLSNDFIFPGTVSRITLNNSPPSREFLKDLKSSVFTNVFVSFGISKGKSFQRLSEFGVFCSAKCSKNSEVILEGLWRGKIIEKIDLGRGYENIEVEKIEDEPIGDVSKLKSEAKDLKRDFSKFVYGCGKDEQINQKEVMAILLALKKFQMNQSDVDDILWKIVSIIPNLGIDIAILFLECTSIGERILYCRNILNDLLKEKLDNENHESNPILRLSEELESNPELKKVFQKFLDIRDILPEDAQQTVVEDFDRLKSLDGPRSGSSEHSMFLGHLEFLLGLPWSIETEQEKSIAKVQEILDQDHACLETIKRSICDFIVPKILNPKGKADILCFVGPPGVGKTSLGASIARALNRKFVRMSVGGLNDEAEIRGHRVTYIGAKPGRVLELLKRCGSKNPVFLIDEMDKLEKSARGDPGSALLEVLDPEQNNSFRDHYLGTGFDLSQIFFICTANVEEDIPRALIDRVDVIRLPGYLETEKIEIAKRFLIKKISEETGLDKHKEIEWSDEAISKLIRGYTKEAGVRSLTRRIKDITRKLAGEYLRCGDKIKNFKVIPETIESLLGPPKYVVEEARTTGIGVAIGLAWTAYGGEILRVESNFFPRTFETDNLLQTGLQKKVMQEANRAAITNLGRWIDEKEIREKLEKYIIHIHIPEGATPKDGPSAGITVFSAMYSLLKKIKLRPLIAMTGEINLEGEVLPIGGVKEKVVAAMMAGIKEVILPRANERNLHDVPKEVKDKVRFHLVSNIDEVIKIAFENRVSA